MRCSIVRALLLLVAALATSAAFAADEKPLRIIAFGAHPDDCELDAGGTAARWAKLGHKVKFVSVTNGDIGHHEIAGAPLARGAWPRSSAARRSSVSRPRCSTTTTASSCPRWKTVARSPG